MERGKKEMLALFDMLMAVNEWWMICGVWCVVVVGQKGVRRKGSWSPVVRWIELLVSLTEVELRRMECRRSAK